MGNVKEFMSKEENRRFVLFSVVSLAASALDLILFAVLCNPLFKVMGDPYYIWVDTVIARVVSSLANYFVNYYIVFKSRETLAKSGLKFTALTIIKTIVSALAVSGLVLILPKVPEVLLKMPVDTALFFLNYIVQKKFIY